MKKLFLLLTAGVISLGAGAQNIKSHSMVRIDATQVPQPLPFEGNATVQLARTAVSSDGAQHKSTAGGTRIYNYVETIAAINQNIASNQVYPYMWFRPDILAAYTDPNNPSGIIADTIRFGSIATLLHPFAPILNDAMYFDANYPTPDGTLIGITAADAYTVDSVSITGFYSRNKDNNTTVDTLRFAFIYGDGTGNSNIPESGFANGNIRFGTIFHDSFANVGTGIQGGPTVVYQDLYLTTADTGINGNVLPKFTVPANLSVPAGNMVAVTVTFKSGDDGNYTPYTDTAFRSTWNSDNPYKYGMFRPLFLEEEDGQQPSHTAGNFNAGYVKYLPPYRYNTWEIQYLPHWAFTTGDFATEWPYIDFYISCATCKVVTEIPQPDPEDPESVRGISGVINNVSAYPNPAQDFIRIPVTLSKSTDVKVSLLNTVGQVLQTQQLHGNTVTAEFNTAGIPSGVYIYSVEADGQRSTGRVSITR